MTSSPVHRKNGFALMSVIFILVLLAGLAFVITRLTTSSPSASVGDLASQRALLSAKSGTEWAIRKAKDNNWSSATDLAVLDGHYLLPDGTGFDLKYDGIIDTLTATATIDSSERQMVTDNFSARLTTEGQCSFPPDPSYPTVTLEGQAEETLGPGSVYLSSVSLKGSANLNLKGPMVLYVDGTFELEGSSSVTTSDDVMIVVRGQTAVEDKASIVMTSGTLYLHTDASLSFSGNSKVNVGGDVSQTMFTAVRDITLSGNSSVNAALYAGADMMLANSTSFSGAAGFDGTASIRQNAEFSYRQNAGTGVTGNSFFGLCIDTPNGLGNMVP